MTTKNVIFRNMKNSLLIIAASSTIVLGMRDRFSLCVGVSNLSSSAFTVLGVRRGFSLVPRRLEI